MLKPKQTLSYQFELDLLHCSLQSFLQCVQALFLVYLIVKLK